MKTHFILAGCLGLVMWSGTAQGQNFAWVKKIGSTGSEEGHSIKTDASGNIYATGFFNNTVDFDPGPATLNLSSGPPVNTFIIKLNATGNLVWAKQYGGGSDAFGRSIAVDASGSVYVIGNSLFAHFIIKLDNTGNFIWTKTFSTLLFIDGNSIAVDAAGNVYASGYFGATTDFDPGPDTFNLTPTGGGVFIIKLSAAGNLIWAKQFSSISSSLVVDAIGNVYITGTFQGTADFDPGIGIFNLTTMGGDDVYTVKLDSIGNLVWAKQFGGSQNDSGNSLVIGHAGNLFVTGSFNGIADFDPGADVFNLTSLTTSNVFITKLDNAGNFIWARQTAGSSGNSIAIDLYETIYVGGQFDSTSAFITQFAATGNIVFSSLFEGATMRSISTDATGNIYTTGSFTDTVDFDPGSDTFNLTPTAWHDIFILKLLQVTPYAVQGNIFGDLNTNCNNDTSDVSFSNVLIKATPGSYYGMTDNNGNYAVYLFDTGSYTISFAKQDSLWNPSCASSYNIHVASIPDTTSAIDFAMEATHYCPRLTIDVGAPRLRCCTSNTYTFMYHSTGTLPASNAFVEVDFGEFLNPQSSTIPWSTVAGNVYTFPLGNIGINQSGSFGVTVLLDCTAPIGSTQCVTAHIFPDAPCVPVSTGDSSETTINGSCINDSIVCFTIRNQGVGNMSVPATWRLYANDTLLTQGTYQLAAGDTLTNCYPANGKTYRFETDHPHPRITRPRVIIEACGTNANGGVDFGFVNSVAQDDAELFIDIFCTQVICSWDPNDKQVSPVGITANKYIKPEDELEYLIRFQNTGNDTAFKVVIRDTIQTDVIDIATLTSGASSHDYTFNIYGHGIAEWTFDNILLPDSNVNEPASHGFVQFKAKLLPNITPGTLVTNSADIYFDFNAPVTTNEVWNTVFDTVLRGTVIISGAILTESGLPVPGVKVTLAGTATDSMVTTADGLYGFETESGGNYTVTPSKNNDSIAANGVTAYDILLMRRHLLATGALPSPYKIIAAAEVSADADTVITTQDIVHLRSLILGNSTALPGNRLWQFVSSDYTFPDATHPFPFNKTRTYTNIISSQSNQNFIGIKLGDVNESYH